MQTIIPTNQNQQNNQQATLKQPTQKHNSAPKTPNTQNPQYRNQSNQKLKTKPRSSTRESTRKHQNHQ